MARPEPKAVLLHTLLLLWAGCAGEIAPPKNDTMGSDTGQQDLSGSPDILPEQGPPPGDISPIPDTGLKSYGNKCIWTGKVTKCSDGKSDCIPNYVTSTAGPGYCSVKCKLYGKCPANPKGTEFGTYTGCLYIFNGQPYCTFLCLYQGTMYVCPKGFACHKFTNGQSFCWPQ